MKRFLVIAILFSVALATSVASKAQLSTLYGGVPNQYTARDTSTNAAYVIKKFKITEQRNTVTFQLNAKKISGTVAGTWQVLGSIDGGVSFAPVASVTLADADSTYGYVVTNNPYTYYKTVVKNTGTQVSSYVTYLLYR